MASTSEAPPADEIQLAEIISPMVLERTPQISESPEQLAPTMSPRHSKAQLAAIMIMLYASPPAVDQA
jgi:hypothetical protein